MLEALPVDLPADQRCTGLELPAWDASAWISGRRQYTGHRLPVPLLACSRPAFHFIPVKKNPAGITGRGSAEAPAGLESAAGASCFQRRPISAPALSCRPGMLQRETLVGSNTPLIVCRFLCWPLPAGYAASYR